VFTESIGQKVGRKKCLLEKFGDGM